MSNSHLSEEEVAEKVAEAIAEADALSKSQIDVERDDELDDTSITGDEFLRSYNKYELEFIDDEFDPKKINKKNKTKQQQTKIVKGGKRSIQTSTETSTTSTVTASTANTAKKSKHLKKDVELPLKIDLIALVKKEKCLYNLKDPMYMSRVHKQKVWEEISANLQPNYADMNVDKCKKVWNSVRESTR